MTCDIHSRSLLDNYTVAALQMRNSKIYAAKTVIRWQKIKIKKKKENNFVSNKFHAALLILLWYALDLLDVRWK